MQRQLSIDMEVLYRQHSRRVLASLVRRVCDFDLAEESMHEAFAIALDRWPQQGLPDNPTAWLVTTGYHRAIDRLRRRARFEHASDPLLDELESAPVDVDQAIEDDELRLIFTCCHPELAFTSRLALTLREVCGLTTEEIARAFLLKPTTVAQRIVRAKARLRDRQVAFSAPESSELAERLDTVLHVIYLMFTEGYSTSSGEEATRAELSSEAIRLGRRLCELVADADCFGLLALMLLQESRRSARTDASGNLVLLADQNRQLWDSRLIEEGLDWLWQALEAGEIGAFTLQAAIAAEHARAGSSEQTRWDRISALYDVLVDVSPTPVVRLNRAVAISMHQGAEAGMALIDELLESGKLSDYHRLHVARAEMHYRLGQQARAVESWHRALLLTSHPREQELLQRRIDEISKG
ncbi:RNA polymerase sigma factor [Halomonas huangheensis]|nr:RNA polymerase sigma factor [Halomonas huangheensis]